MMSPLYGERDSIRVRDLPDHPGVRLVAFDRPEARNAFNSAMYGAFAAALHDARDDDAVRVVVVTGTGNSFCGGHDAGDLAGIARQRQPGEPVSSGRPDLLQALSAFDKPMVMAVNGPAVGWGFTMLAHADIVIVGESAAMMAPFVQYGVPPEAASSYLFPARLGWQRAAQILFTGEWMSAEEAVDWGIALECVPDAVLVATAMRLATRIALGTTISLRSIKALMKSWERPFVNHALAAESASYAHPQAVAPEAGPISR